MTPPSTSLPPADDELWALVEALVEGAAIPADRERLEARLRAEPAARLFYVAFLDLHAHLQWRTRGEAPVVARSPDRATPPTEGLPQRVETFGRSRWHGQETVPQQSQQGVAVAPRSGFRLPHWGHAALAASFLLAAGLLGAFFALRHGPEDEESPELRGAPAGSVAVLIDDGNSVWEKGTTLPTGTGSALRPGRLKLRSGVVEIAFHKGGEVLLEGPADFEISAADSAFLHRGKLTAKVPDGAPAFQVAMPGVVVTDLVGECGLLRDESGLTEVHVFEGDIGASATDGKGESLTEKHLAENAGARVDAAQHTFTSVPLNEQVFAHLRPEIRVADASVRGGKFAGRNFGTVSQLMVKNSIADYSWDTYLRFDLSGVKGKVSAASVRLVPLRVGHSLDNAAALVSDNRWNESTITWNTKPASGPTFARWQVEEGEPVEFDVTNFVQAALDGDKRLSLRIFAPGYQRGSAYVQYGSRRGDAESRPQLLLTIVP